MDLLDIVVPIYTDLGKTRTCLESVLRAGIDNLAELQLIYDCGPDEDLEQYLEVLSASHAGVYLHKNTTNLGFVKTVNKGFLLNRNRDVIILNSDTIVYSNWINRLRTLGASDSKIATITPFSNNAEICSFPKFCQDNRIPPHVPLAWLDEQCAKQSTRKLIEVPTGVGFCMWIRRSVLTEVGPFDEERFGRGYGEENDFCRRASAGGYKNVVANNVFVYHEGGVSFGPEKFKLIEGAIAKVERKHPGYIKQVHEFISRDELRPLRAGVMNDILRATSRPIVLAITHDLAGGTKQYLNDLIVYKEQEFETLLLQPAPNDCVRLTLPEWMGESYLFNVKQDYELLKDYLLSVGVNLILLNHIKGNENYVSLLQKDLGIETWCVLHDYYFIYGSPTLTDNEGLFLFSNLTDEQQLSCSDYRPEEMDLGDWQAKVHQPLFTATKVIAPSQSVKKMYNRFFPSLNIEVRPHRDQEAHGGYGAVPIVPGMNKRAIVVIGALNKEKGADLLEAVANMARIQYPELEFHLLGYAYRPLANSVRTFGPYAEHDLPEILAKLDPVMVWYPCQWPETYSYTLSRVLERGYPLLIPKLGALEDRTINRPLTRVVQYPQPAQHWLDEIASFVTLLSSGHARGTPWVEPENTAAFYQSAWQLPGKRQIDAPGADVFERILTCLSPKIECSYRRERMLSVLFALRQLPVLRSIAALIPIHRQRQLKRLLSSKPVHDVVR